MLRKIVKKSINQPKKLSNPAEQLRSPQWDLSAAAVRRLLIYPRRQRDRRSKPHSVSLLYRLREKIQYT